ncbi:MAG: hypothetical protein ACD_66C00239G0001, partial [uncultured bacterium]
MSNISKTVQEHVLAESQKSESLFKDAYKEHFEGSYANHGSKV